MDERFVGSFKRQFEWRGFDIDDSMHYHKNEDCEAYKSIYVGTCLPIQKTLYFDSTDFLLHKQF